MFFHVFSEEHQMSFASSYEPPTYGRLFWEGEVRTRSEARRTAVGQWLREGGSEVLEHTITVEGFESCPEHGNACENANYGEPVNGTRPFTGHFDVEASE